MPARTTISEPAIVGTTEHPVIIGYDAYLQGRSGFLAKLRSNPPKRALLSYVPQPIINDLHGLPTSKFSNEGIAQSWARVLNELGYIVDVISWDDASFEPEHAYDLVILHGGLNFNVYQDLPNTPPLIHFLTGTQWKFNNSAAAERLKDFKVRHGVSLKPERAIDEREEAVNQAAQAIIMLGTDTIKKTFSAYPNVININLASFPDTHFDTVTKDYGTARKNFLFHAGGGNIHKGLDLLLDVFKDLSEEHLYIANFIQPEIKEAFKKELGRPNIHVVGEVGMRSPEFYEAMDACGYLILPSCSEGQSGAVVEGMNQGLVPVVSKYCGVDTEDFGVTLPDCSLPQLTKTIRQLAAVDPQTVRKNSLAARKSAQTTYTPDMFRRRLSRAITQALSA